MTDEQIVLLLKRIKASDDGPAFMEFLEHLSKNNYKLWKRASGEDAFVKQGYAICVDSLIESFAECSKEQQDSPRSFTNWTD